MPLSIGVNLRVTGHCNQGGRKYMEDMFSVAFQPTPDDKDLEYAFFGIFDGHGGVEAATFAKEHLMDIIVKQKNFWSDRDEDVLRAIKDGYVNTHYAMWRELDKWPRTASGLPSTAGTTASVAFIRKGKIYIGHVGDSGIILGYQTDGEAQWKAKALTKDHKPESAPEMIRIQQSGGKVVSKSGVPRVVWNRPRIGHKGPVRRSTHIDEIPFLAVARSLGDLWSYNSELDTFVVSPEPDVKVVAIDVKAHRCLIFGTDGLWNMLTPHAAVAIVQAADRHNEKQLIASQQTCIGTDTQMWINPSKSLVDRALERWSSTRLRADNTSVVTLMLDPPGPSRSEVLLNQKERILMQNRLHVSPPDSAVLETVETVERMTSSPVLVSIPSENIERFLSPPVPGISHPESIQRATPSSQDLAAILMENPTNPQTSLPTPVGNTNMLLIDSSSDISQQSASPVPTCFTSERFEIFSAVLDRPLEEKSMVTALDSAPMSSELETEVEENLMNSNVEEESNMEEPSPVAELASTEERISEEHEKHENLISLDSNHEDDIEKVETKEDNLGELLSPLEFNHAPVDENLPEESNLDSVTVEPSKKSIQVAEISSSHLSEEGTENSPSTTSTSRAANEVEIIAVKKAVRCERVRLCVRRLTKIRPASAIPEQHVDSEAPSTSLPSNSVKESLEVTRETKSLSEGYELKNMLSYARPQQQQCLFSSSSSSSSSSSRSSELIRGLKRRHSLLSQNEYSQIDTGSPEKSIVTINSRFKARNGKVGVVCDLAQGDVRKKTGHSVPTKRRYSAITIQDVGEDSRILDEPSMKRRTRSEDRPNFSHEGNNVIEDPNSRVSWSTVDLPSCRSSEQCTVNNSNNSSNGTVNNNNNSGNNNVPVERLSSPPNTFQRRSLAKKATPVKTIRPPSINGSSRLQQWRGSFGLRDWDQNRNNRGRNCSERRISRTVSVITSARESTPSQRWLRSDTIAATTVKTLRSRNVDINGQTISSQLVHQYGVAKQNRLPTPNKLKHTNNNSTLQSVAGRVRSSSVSSSSSKLKQPGNGSTTNIGSCSGLNSSSTACTSNSGIVKRVKSSYTSSSRTLATRSRMKILSYGK